MSERPKNVLPSGSRTKGSVIVLRCQTCRQSNEYKVPMVSADLVNHERRRAENAEEYLRACAGDEFALVATKDLEQITTVIDTLAGWIEANVPGTTVYKHNGYVVT